MSVVEDFHIDRAAIDVSSWKDGLHSLARETLEAALAVDDGFLKNDEMGQHQKAQADDAARPTLALLKGAYSGNDFEASVEVREEVFNLFDPGRMIGIHEQNALTRRLQAAGAHGGSLALVGG